MDLSIVKVAVRLVKLAQILLFVLPAYPDISITAILAVLLALPDIMLTTLQIHVFLVLALARLAQVCQRVCLAVKVFGMVLFVLILVRTGNMEILLTMFVITVIRVALHVSLHQLLALHVSVRSFSTINNASELVHLGTITQAESVLPVCHHAILVHHRASVLAVLITSF
jgi:hypothetical protein